MAFGWRTVALCALALPAGAAQAQLYFRADTGVSISSNANFGDNVSGDLICSDASCTRGQRFGDFGNGVILNAGLGAHFGSNSRLEVAFGYRKYMLDAFDGTATEFRADITSLSMMANGYYDFSGPGWKPYLGLGIGTSQNKIDSLQFDNGGAFFGSTPGGTKTNFAWAFMAGGGFPISYTTVLDLGYRYIDLGKVQIPAGGPVSIGGIVSPPPYGGASGNLRAHEFTIGLRF